jgi:hypothetical protein
LGVLRDYPVREILAVYQTRALKESIIVENDFYHTIPKCSETRFPQELEDVPFSLSVSPAIRFVWELSGLNVHYRAGYSPGKAGEGSLLTWPRRALNWRRET